MEQVQLILFVILIHVTGAGGALLFGRISDQRSSKQAILVSLGILLLDLIALFFIESVTHFYIIGAIAGFALSGAQAVSRTMVSQLAPNGKTTEFYGFLSVAGRTSTFIGPLVFGTLSYRGHAFYLARGMSDLAAEQGLILGNWLDHRFLADWRHCAAERTQSNRRAADGILRQTFPGGSGMKVNYWRAGYIEHHCLIARR